MVAANGVVARFLSARKFPSIRHVVRTPKRWDRIVELAGEHQVKLPDIPNSKALEEFLLKEKAEEPVSLPRPIPRSDQAFGLWRIPCRTS